jgi:hypothetical protein
MSFVQTAAAPPSSEGLSSAVVLAIAAGAALLVAPVAALVVDLAGPRRVRGPDDLTAAVSAPALASVPARWRRRRSRSIRAAGARERTAYRGLRVRVEHLLVPHRTLMVVRPARGEGRTGGGQPRPRAGPVGLQGGCRRPRRGQTRPGHHAGPGLAAGAPARPGRRGSRHQRCLWSRALALRHQLRADCETPAARDTERGLLSQAHSLVRLGGCPNEKGVP